MATKPEPKTRPKSDSETVDKSPLERMTELTRRVVNVPKDEALATDKKQSRGRGSEH
jgi:hypothetical protein